MKLQLLCRLFSFSKEHNVFFFVFFDIFVNAASELPPCLGVSLHSGKPDI